VVFIVLGVAMIMMSRKLWKKVAVENIEE